MSRWTDRILAALGLGDRKPEADVSYDPAEADRTAGRAAAPSDEGTPVQVSEQQAAGQAQSRPAGRGEAAGAEREPGGH
jgi:hypothetical protein